MSAAHYHSHGGDRAMSFFRPEDLCVGERYRLTEVIEGREVSFGEYVLVYIEIVPKMNPPVLGFARAKDSGAQIFLVKMYGDSTWRRAFKQSQGLWEVYSPIGAVFWNRSYVLVEKVT
ncbi:MAG: hypothetical protein G01um101448_283 [Parcubacteria group bacterium Gr01-1014_48]|nr:MAG: hypothetical protein Greene041614_601 [Parcubacteria group bacterium Greene0416_14]TSC74173.1 MAG: hypothetical protein G01um101448_283 [Parcubacteria group bacterium Gr01-1014_48]TSD00849.1 MAG: hypothetical protein Greene101415_650 [Parcubacteria group bacterium Greene1014_15]TSD07931.1 MAG: hypothetical protein Greene07144_561 [Parcubacteria group bacterium Greene0714_4]